MFKIRLQLRNAFGLCVVGNGSWKDEAFGKFYVRSNPFQVKRSLHVKQELGKNFQTPIFQHLDFRSSLSNKEGIRERVSWKDGDV